MTGPRTQLIPFHFICDILKESHFVASDPGSWFSLIINRAFFQVLFNVVMTVPFGVYLRYYFGCHLKKTLLLSFLLSLFFELTQLSGLYFIYPRNYRLFDVDDLMANTLGGVLGYLLVGPFLKILPTRREIDEASFRRGREVSLARKAAGSDDRHSLRRTFCPSAGSAFADRERHRVVFLLRNLLRPDSGAASGQDCGKADPSNRYPVGGWQPRALVSVSSPLRQPLGSALCPSGIVDSGLEAAAAVAGLGMIWTVMIRGIFRTAYFFFLVAEIVMLALHRPLFYEKLSKTGLVSTIRKEK